MYRKLLAVLMTVCLVAALFAGCGGKGGDDPSVSANAGASATDGSGPAAGADAALPGQSQNADGQGGTEQTDHSDESGGSSSTTKSSGGGTSTTKPSGNGSSATKPSGGGSSATKPSGGSTSTTKPSGGGSETNSKAQIVSYFNAAANKVKTGKPKLEASYSIYMDIPMDVPGVDPFEPTSKTFNKTYSAKSNLDDAFPVFGQSWASRLSVSAVKSASRTFSNGNYTIQIVLNDENNVFSIGSSEHGKAFSSYFSDEDIKKALVEAGEDFNIRSFDNSLHDSSITCIVNKQTGNMLSATYILKNNMSVKVGSPAAFAFPIQFDNLQSYKMTW